MRHVLLLSGNLSFYFVLTLYLQNGLHFAPFDAALIVVPMAIAFVAGSRLVTARVAKRGMVALAEGCMVQAAGLAATALLDRHDRAADDDDADAAIGLFGYGQGMVLTPLFSAVLANVRHAHAGAGSGILATTQQVANGRRGDHGRDVFCRAGGSRRARCAARGNGRIGLRSGSDARLPPAHANSLVGYAIACGVSATLSPASRPDRVLYRRSLIATHRSDCHGRATPGHDSPQDVWVIIDEVWY